MYLLRGTEFSMCIATWVRIRLCIATWEQNQYMFTKWESNLLGNEIRTYIATWERNQYMCYVVPNRGTFKYSYSVSSIITTRATVFL